MSFGTRIKQYIDYKGLSVRSFELKSTLKNGAIYRVIKNNTSLNGDSIATQGNTWDDLNLNWLLKGDGEMLLSSTIVKEPYQSYGSEKDVTEEVKWYKDALQRADAQIELQKDMIKTLKLIIEKQQNTAKKAGIDL